MAVSDRAPNRRLLTRRDAAKLSVSAALGGALLPVGVDAAHATETGDFQAAFAEATRGKTPTMGRVKLTLPELAENGNSVTAQVDVESPMSAASHVKTVSIIAEKNPQPLLFRAHFGPRAGRARVGTSVRLADTQRVVAIAEMNDGAIFMGEARVIVTLAACVDGG
jgi:sulfur-oxidizing protein SoxY